MSRAAARRLTTRPTARRFTSRNVGETVAATVLGGVLAGAVGTLVDLTLVAAVVGAANGAIAGWRRIYRWRSISGWVAFVLDSTWALVTTAAALGAHAVAASQRHPGNAVAELSERCDRHVYERGYVLRRGFLLTVGNVVNGAGTARASRARTVEQHEDSHVWQARCFGPLFPAIYAVWWFGGAVIALAVWLIRRPAAGLGAMVDAFGYYRNPFEWWAYSREGRWPPPRAVTALVWRRPLASPRRRVRVPSRARR